MNALILIVTAIILYLLYELRKSKTVDGFLNLVHLKLTRKPTHEALLLWAKRHGNVFPLRLGDFNLVVINGHKQIKEALGNSRLDGRPDFTPFQLLPSRSNKGIFNGSGDAWTTTRHLTLHHLKNYGMGKKALDVDIHAALDSIMAAISTDEAVCLEAYLSEEVTAFMGTLLIGSDIDPVVPKLMMNIAREVNSVGTLGFFPSLIRSPLSSWVFGSSRLEGLKEELKVLIAKLIHDCTEETHSDSVLMGLLVDLKKAQLVDETVAIVSDMLFGGSVKLASTLQWAILYLAAHPITQRELQVEIDEVIGENCIPSISARPQMPYAIAVLMETLRKSSFFPLGAFHQATSPIEFNNGVSIKEGTVVCMNLWSSHHDPNVWDQPNQFKPDRFIRYDEEGRRKVIRHEASLPFSAGGRGCLGELMAKEFLFLSLVSIFQRFDIRLTNSADRDLLFESTCHWLGLPPRVAVVLRNRNK